VKLQASRRTRTFDAQKDADIARLVLGALAGRIDDTDVVRPRVLQRNESDLDFVRRLAARSDRLLVAREGRLDFVRPAYAARPILLDARSIEDLDAEITPLQVPPSLTVIGWDAASAQRVEGTASGADLQVIGDGRRATEAAADLWAEGSALCDVHLDAQSTARQLAVAELNRLARTLVRGTATVVGRADLRAGSRAKLAATRPGFDLDVLVVGSRHLLEAGRGYTVELRFCSNTMPT
jgi:phage protein D